jgi:hypothetical protein
VVTLCSFGLVFRPPNMLNVHILYWSVFSLIILRVMLWTCYLILLLLNSVMCILASLTEGLDTHSSWEHCKRNKPNQRQCSFSPSREGREGRELLTVHVYSSAAWVLLFSILVVLPLS